MTAKRKVTKQKTIWVARQGLGSNWDEYKVYIGKKEPKYEEITDYFGEVRGLVLAEEGVTDLCAPDWHRATGIRLKRGEVVKIKVSVVK